MDQTRLRDSTDQPATKRVGYVGWVGQSNLGDEAMYSAFDNVLFKEVDIIPLTGKNRNQRFDAAFLGGGTMINRDPGFLRTFQMAQASCPKSYVFGTGVCGDEFWRTRPGWKDRMPEWLDCLNKAEFIGLRGPYSRQRLLEYGVSNTEVIGDPALSLALPTVKPKKFARHIGISVGTSHGHVWGNERDVLEAVIKVAWELVQRGWTITFVPVWPPDLRYNEAAAQFISSPEVSVFHKFYSIKKTMDLMESVDVFIGEKLHSVVLAMCVYTPSIMLEYRPKCRDFMASLDLEAFNIPTDKLSVEQILHLVDKLYADIPRYQEILRERISFYVRKQRQCADMIDI